MPIPSCLGFNLAYRGNCFLPSAEGVGCYLMKQVHPPMSMTLIPLWVRNTKWGICVQKVRYLCAQSGGFVSSTPTGSTFLSLRVRNRTQPIIPYTIHQAYYFTRLFDLPLPAEPRLMAVKRLYNYDTPLATAHLHVR